MPESNTTAIYAALYAEMKEGILAEQTDYASKPLTDHLKGMIHGFSALLALY